MQNSDKRRITLAAMCFTAVAVTAWFLVEALFFQSRGPGDIKLPAIAFFTIQSNIMAVLWLLYTGLSLSVKGVPKPHAALGLSLSCYITVTGVVYWLVLVPMLGFAKEFFTFSNIWMHTAVPVIVLIVYSMLAKKEKLPWISVLLMLIYPFLYTVYAYILHSVTGLYVYPFFNPRVMGSFSASMIVLALIGGLFAGLGFFYRHIGNRRQAGKTGRQKRRYNDSPME